MFGTGCAHKTKRSADEAPPAAAAISILPSLFGKHLYSITTLSGFTVGFLAGVIFGPNPAGAAIGHDHYGWAIWGVVFFASVIIGIGVEILKKRGLIK